MNTLLWITWNPSKTAFTLPYFNIDIAWYGVFFALGFLLGYLIIVPLFKQVVWQSNTITSRDIANWDKLINALRNPTSPAAAAIGKKLSLDGVSAGTPPPKEVQKKVFDGLTKTLNDPTLSLTRKKLEIILPEAITPASTIGAQAADKLMWYAIIGTVVGARLGHVLFYDLEMLIHDPMEIFMLRNGGLASHGGTVGVMIAIIFYLRNTRTLLPELSFVSLMDIMVIPTAVVACCIRIGNFINQEILGTPSSAPWAVVFGNPADGSFPTPRHPAQLYEAGLYLAIFVILMAIWFRWKGSLKTGFISGIFFILCFGGRFLIEFYKERQGGIVDESFLQIGQYLSIPFVILGIYLAFFYQNKSLTQISPSTKNS